MHIFVTTSDGKRTIYESDRFATVRDLKLKIGRAMGMPMTYARLMLNGQLLPNNGVLEDLGIKRLSNIDMIFRPIVFTTKQLSERESERRKSTAVQSINTNVKQGKSVSAANCLRASNGCQNRLRRETSDSDVEYIGDF